MTQPSFVPIAEADQVRPALHLKVPSAWSADRPADHRVPGIPIGRGYGSPGPDQGFALSLARRFEDRIRLTPDEEIEDVLTGCALIASRRAAAFGRAPCVYDLDAAFALFGFLNGDPPADVVESRTTKFRSVSHSYEAQRELVDSIPEEALSALPALIG